MQPDRHARREYIAAFREIVARIAGSLTDLPSRALPIKMYVAGGAALHMYTGARISRDVDASFSRRIVLPENLEVAYRDADGAAHLLYFDRQYNDSLALMHEDAYDDSVQLSLSGHDAKFLEVRLLSALDLAVSKIARFSSQDRDDIAILARRKLITSKALRQRAGQALTAYVGTLTSGQGSIELACRIVTDAGSRSSR